MPHISITVTMVLVVLDVILLVVFIDHIAKSIQLPQVIASIAGDLSGAIETESALAVSNASKAGPSLTEMLARLDEDSGVVCAPRSGYLQYLRMSTLIEISRSSKAVIRLLHRPGHFVVEGEPLADVWPAAAAPGVARALGGAHRPDRTERSRKTSRSPSINWSRSRSGPCRRRSTTRSLPLPASTGSATRYARS